MKIPNTIDKNTFFLYAPGNETLLLPNEINRKLRGENFEWDSDTPLTLIELCQNVLIKNFKKPLEQLFPIDLQYILENLPITLELESAIGDIPDGVYWKTRYLNRWQSTKQESWKSAFIERHIQELLETLEPEHYDDNEYRPIFVAASPYVKVLKVRELQQEKLLPHEESRPLIHHINFSLILKHFENVTELDLVFGPKNVGNKFEFSLFELSVEDCKNLAAGINTMPLIKILRVHNSLVKDNHFQILIRGIIGNKTLVETDFSHCQIANKGAFYAAEFIRKHRTLEIMKLANNLITFEGVVAISYVLQTLNTCPLKHLDLRLNHLGSEGLKLLFSCLIRNEKRPSELNLAAIGFTEEDAIILGDTILPLNKSLNYLDISNNVCGLEGGKAIARGVERHSHLVYLDIRNCGFDPESEMSVKKSIFRNKCLLEKRFCFEPDFLEMKSTPSGTMGVEELDGEEEQSEY